jgi:hypothetical protein
MEAGGRLERDVDKETVRIDTGETKTIPCFWPVISNLPVERADISLGISYRPAFWPFRLEKSFRFVAERSANGDIRFLKQPRKKSD